MGVFYTCSYGGMVLMSAAAGLSGDLTGTSAAPIVFGGVLLFLAVPVLGLFRALEARGVGMLVAQGDASTGG